MLRLEIQCFCHGGYVNVCFCDTVPDLMFLVVLDKRVGKDEPEADNYF